MWWLALSAAALAGECPERITPEALDARVRAMEEPVLFLEDDAYAALEDFEALLDGCVDGALTPEQIARVWISVGAGDFLFSGSLKAEAELRLGSALALVGPEGWLEVFGPDAEQAYLRSSAVALGGALLYVGLPPDTVVVLDGTILYERGVVPTTPGLHLVQWMEGEAWTGELMTLERGGRASPGGVPLPDDLGAVEVSDKSSPKIGQRLAERERRERAPKEPAEAVVQTDSAAGGVPEGFGLSASAGGGVGVLAGRISSEGYGVNGAATRPLVRAELRAGSQWWGGLEATLAPAADNGLTWPGSVSALGGWRGGIAGWVYVEAGMGAALSGAPVFAVPDDIDPDEPFIADFDAGRARGLRFSGRVTALDPRSVGPLPLTLGLNTQLDLAKGFLVWELGPTASTTLGPVRPGLTWTPGLLVAGESRLFRSTLLLEVSWAL